MSCDSVSTTIPGYNPHDLWMYENAGWLDLEGLDLQARYNLSDRTTIAAAAVSHEADYSGNGYCRGTQKSRRNNNVTEY